MTFKDTSRERETFFTSALFVLWKQTFTSSREGELPALFCGSSRLPDVLVGHWCLCWLQGLHQAGSSHHTACGLWILWALPFTFIKSFSQDGLLPCPVVFHCLSLLLTHLILPPIHNGVMYKWLSHLKWRVPVWCHSWGLLFCPALALFNLACFFFGRNLEGLSSFPSPMTSFFLNFCLAVCSVAWIVRRVVLSQFRTESNER